MRKINEAVMAIQLEKKYTKDKILEMYLNTIYFGVGTYGVEKASQAYFGISANDLNLQQAALLAALVKAPSIYNPYSDIKKVQDRRNLVLKLMYEQQRIDKEQYLNAISSPVELNKDTQLAEGEQQNQIAPYFIDYVKPVSYTHLRAHETRHD